MKTGGAHTRFEAVVLGGSYIALVAANALGEILKFGGVTAADVSNEVFTWFVPAGYVFSIWSLIYIGLAVWVVRFILSVRSAALAQKGALKSSGNEVRLFVASCVLNVIWLALWHLRVFIPSIVVMAVLLAVVYALYLATRARSRSWLDRIPVALYASWLAVATVANVAHVITRFTTVDAGVIPAVSTLVLLALFVLATFVVRRTFHEYAFGCVVAWAGIGIGVHVMAVSPVVGIVAILISTLGVAIAQFC